MRLEFTPKVRRGLFQRYALLDDRSLLGEELRDEILDACSSYSSKTDLWSEEDLVHFEELMTDLSKDKDGWPHSRLKEVEVDLLFWYPVQNLFHGYFNSVAELRRPLNKTVLVALYQILSSSQQTDYFSLADCLLNAIITEFNVGEGKQRSYELLYAMMDVQFMVQLKLCEQKRTLRFFDYFEFQQNIKLKTLNTAIIEIQKKTLDNFQLCLARMTDSPTSQNHTRIEQQLKKEFGEDKIEIDMIEYVFASFKCLVTDRIFGQVHNIEYFLEKVPASTTIDNLIKMIKNQDGKYSTDLMVEAVEILICLVQIDLLKEFKSFNERKNPYFKETCRHFNFLAQTLVVLVNYHTKPAQNQDMEQDQSNDQTYLSSHSQRYLFAYLSFLQAFIEIKTREMQQTFYPQLFEPLIELASALPQNRMYNINLTIQDLAVQILKEITKRSYIFDDSGLITLIIDRLKVEFKILSEDLNPNLTQPWKPNRAKDDIKIMSTSLRWRHHFISTTLGFLCYAIIRTDPNSLTQQQTFIAHSRKILESNLFEESIMELVFLQNQYPPLPYYEKVIDPIYLDCVQLYTYLGNDLPQKIGDLIDQGIITTILHSLERRIPIQLNLLTVIIKFFKMLNLNSKGTEALLQCQAIEQFFGLALDHRSHKMLVMPHGSNNMFDCRSQINSFANENQQISDRIYKKCISNIENVQQISWSLTLDYLKMEEQIKDIPNEDDQVKFKDPYGKKQINFEQVLESSVALLSYFCMDELEYLEDLKFNESCVTKTIKANDSNEILFRVMRTPIICSAADGFIYHFQEQTTAINMIQNGLDGFQSYLVFLDGVLEQSFNDLFTIFGTNNLDSLTTFPKESQLHYADLAEHQATNPQRESLKEMKLEVLAQVAICKIHILIEMLIILGTLSKMHERLGILPAYQNFIDQIVQRDLGGYKSMIQLRNFLTRYYSEVYVDSILDQMKRKDVLIQKFRQTLENDYNWDNYQESQEPFSELEDARNLFWRFEKNTAQSLIGGYANDVAKNSFEFILPETIGVIQTYKCHKKLETFFSQLHNSYNKDKRKGHLKDKFVNQAPLFNTKNSNSTGQFISFIASQCQQTNFNVEQTLKTALIVERLLPMISKHLGYKYKNQVNGIYLLHLVSEEKIVENLGQILVWAVNQYLQLEAQPNKKSLFIARNISVIVRDIVAFFLALLRTSYLNTNLHSFLNFFRKDVTTELTQEVANDLFPICVEMTKNLLQMHVLFPIAKILFFGQLEQNWKHFSIPIQENVIKVYQILCQGGFRDPNGFFSQWNIKKENRISRFSEGLMRRGLGFLRPFRRLRSESGSELSEFPIPRLELQPQSPNPAMLQQFESMGFNKNASMAALTHHHNDFEAALNALLRGEFMSDTVQQAQTGSDDKQQNKANEEEKQQNDKKTDVVKEPTNPADHLIGISIYYDKDKSLSKQLFALIEDSFVQILSESLAKVSISQRRQVIDNIFTLIKDNLKISAKVDDQTTNETKEFHGRLINKISQENSCAPEWLTVMFVVQVISIQSQKLSNNTQLDITTTLFTLCDRLKAQIQKLNQWVHLKLKPEQFQQPRHISEDQLRDDTAIELATTSLYSLHISISLFYFIVTDFINKQDLNQIRAILQNKDQDEKSAFEETVSYQDVEALKKDVLLQPTEQKDEPTINISESDKLKLVQNVLDCVLNLFKQLNCVQLQIVLRVKQTLKLVIGPAIKILKQISYFQAEGFDFRQQFMQAEGLKLLFDMKIVDSEWQDNRCIWENDKQVEQDLLDMLQNVWNSPRELQKWYETIIKRQLFFQFKANYKRLNENAVSKDDDVDMTLTADQQSGSKQKDFNKNQSKSLSKTQLSGQAVESQNQKSKKNKQSKSKQSQNKVKITENVDLVEDIDHLGEGNQKNGVNKLLKKFEELNEQSFSEFVKYFNSQMFPHVILNFQVFLQACSKVCYLKKIVKPKQEGQDQIDTPEMKIMLKRQVLKELLTDPDFNYGIASKVIQKPDYRCDISKATSEVANQLLELFISQTKGYRMEILKLLREKSLDQQSQVILQNEKLVLPKDTKLEQKIYIFDQVQILRVLTSIIVMKNSVVGLVLKHNDSKTIKFMFRNIYALLSLQIEAEPSRQLTLKDNSQFIPQERIISIESFLVNLLLLNFGSSRNEKAIKKELCQLFIKQMVKGLAFRTSSTDSLWQASCGLLQNFSQIWIMAKFLLIKQRDDDSKNPAAAINQKKQKFWRLQRCNLMKQIIIQSNLNHQNETDIPRFCLLENIQYFCQQLQSPKLYLFDTNRNQCLSTSINVITKILRLFENSQSLGQILKVLGPKPADLSSLDGGSDFPMFQEFDGEDPDSSLDDFESSESDMHESMNEAMESSSSGDDDQSDRPLDALEVAELASIMDESFEDEMLEVSSGWDDDIDNEESFEHELEEMSEAEQEEQDPDFEIINMQDQNPPALAKPGGPRSVSEASWPSGGDRDRSRSQDEIEEDSGEGDENSWDDAEEHNQIISYQDEQSYDQNGDEEDQYSEENMSYEEDSQQDMSQYSMDSQLRNYYQDNPNLRARDRLFDRRAYVFGHSIGSQYGQQHATHPDIRRQEITAQDFFILDENDARNNPYDQGYNHIQDHPFASLLGSFSSIDRMAFGNIFGLKDKSLSAVVQFCTNIFVQKRAISQLKAKIRATEGIYMMQITTVQQVVPSKQPSNILGQQSKPNSSSAKAESSEIIVQNPDDFKDHMKPQPKLQLPISATQRLSQQRPGVISQSNPFIIEGMDPLFMESLSAVGLQNIADSHQIQAQISNQASSIVTQNRFELASNISHYLRHCTPERRADILRQVQNDIARDLPAEIFAEARELYRRDRNGFLRMFNQNQTITQIQHELQAITRNESQQQQSNQPLVQQTTNTDLFNINRDRLASQDSIQLSIDLVGPTELSNSAQKDDKPTNQRKEVTIRGTQYIQNFFIILQDLNARYEKDQAVAQVDKQSELILQQALLPQSNESAQSQFLKIKGTVQTALTAFINLNLDIDTQLTHSIKILHRIPNLRTCLILSVIKQANDELVSAKEHIQKQNVTLECNPYVCSLFFQESNGKIRQLTLSDVVLGALVTVSQLQTTIENQYGAASLESLEIAQQIGKDPLIAKFAGFIGAFDLSKSVIELLVELLLDHFNLVQCYPWVVPERDQKATVQIEFQVHVVNQFTQMLKPVIKMLKQKDAPKVELPITKICELLLSREMLLNKRSLLQVCETLNEIANIQGVLEIQDYLQNRLSAKLKRAINLITDKHERVNSESTIQSQIDQIVEIFAVTNGVVKLKDQTICQEQLLLDIFSQATQLIKAEDEKAIKNQQKNTKRAAYIFKDEIKELMVLIFSLCEYNLRIIFANKPIVSLSQKQNSNSSQQLQQQEVQIQTLTNETLLNKSLCNPQSIESLLETHISPSSTDFIRFKTLISFFVDNRKLINSFIQINCNVINKELLRLALMIPQILDFDTKRLIWKIELKRLQQKYKNEHFQFQIRREHTFQDSYASMFSLSAKQWRGKMAVTFNGEDGIDGGGLFKEWLTVLSKDFFNEDMALFIKSAQGATYYPNSKSVIQPNHIEMFTFIGKIFGKALWDFQLLDCYFVKAFYKIILGIPLSYHDLEDYDPELYKSLSWILNNQGVEMLSSYFVETIEYFGEQKEIELCQGGKDKLVTDENKWEYVQLVTNHRLYKGLAPQIDAFLKGLYFVIPKDLLKLFDSMELELLISGLQNIDIDDLRENTIYENYTATSKPVQYLFEALQEFDNSERAEFIRFVTGSSKVPIEGFKGLRGQNGIQKFTVVRIPGTLQTRLPQSHTCHNQLDLPEYKDKETTKKMLLYAIREGKTFGMV